MYSKLEKYNFHQNIETRSKVIHSGAEIKIFSYMIVK